VTIARRRFLITHSLGLHHRPIAGIVAIAQRYRSRLTIHADARSADGRSVLALLALGATAGTELVLCADGDDGEALLDAVVAHLSALPPE